MLHAQDREAMHTEGGLIGSSTTVGEKNAPTMVLCLALLRLAPTCIISPHSKLCAAGWQAGTSAEVEKQEERATTVLVLGGVRLSVQHDECHIFRSERS